MNGYEIRHQLFQQASDILHQHWFVRVEAEKDAAKHGTRAAVVISPPTFEDIEAYAKKVYAFVQEKDLGKTDEKDDEYFKGQKKR